MEYNTGAPTGGRACYNCEFTRPQSLFRRVLPAVSPAQSFVACARVLRALRRRVFLCVPAASILQSLYPRTFTDTSFTGGDPSHQARECPSKGTPTCYNCGNQGHLSRECTEPAKEKTCYQCGETGHLSRECPTAPAGGARGGFGGGAPGGCQECYKCGKVGHIARNCREGGAGFGGGYGQQQQGGYGGGARGGFGGGFGGQQQGGQTCYSCGGFGHMSRDCTQGQKCYNCTFRTPLH